MSILRTVDELRVACEELDLEVILAKKKVRKADYIKALQKHYRTRVPHGNSFGLNFMLDSIDSPMLCQRLDYLKPAEKEEIFREGSDWVFEQKINGARMVVTYHPDEGFDFYSRNVSVTDYLPITYRDNIWLGDKDYRGVFPTPFVIDAEVKSREKNVSTLLAKRGVVTETELAATCALLALNSEQSLDIQREMGGFDFFTFDILQIGDRSHMGLPYRERYAKVVRMQEALQTAQFPAKLIDRQSFNKEAFLDTIIETGGEGVVAKNLNAIYTPTESRGRDRWVKIKRSQKLGSGDNIEAFVSGFLPGEEGKAWANMVGSLELSIFVQLPNGNEYEHVIAYVSGISFELRTACTELVDGRPQLKQEYYGKVVEVSGQGVSPRAKHLTHAIIETWRPDRDKFTCKIKQETLDKGIL